MKHLLLAAAVTGVIASAATAQSEPSPTELRQQLEVLQQRLDSIETKATHEAAVVETREATRADAAQRSQLLQAEGVVAGWDKGFFLRSADGAYLLKPGVQFQFRSVTNYRHNAEDGDEDTQSGFEIRRLRLRLDGNAISKDLTYSFVWDTSRTSGGLALLDAWVGYRFADQWAFKVGQFKESWTHEKDVPFTNQLAVDRTLVDTLIGGNLTDRVQGVSLTYGNKSEPLRAEFTYSDGSNTKNTDFTDSGKNFGVGGRVEYKFSGEWDAYRDFTAKNNKDDLFVLGGGFDFTESGDADLLLATVDAQYETTNGWGFYAAALGNFGFDAIDGQNYGFVGQASYLLNESWEVFGRYDIVSLDNVAGDDDTFNEITAGVNYYLGPDGAYLHRAKVTVDLTYMPDGSPSNQTGIGVLESDDSQFLIRGQFTFQL